MQFHHKLLDVNAFLKQCISLFSLHYIDNFSFKSHDFFLGLLSECAFLRYKLSFVRLDSENTKHSQNYYRGC